MNPEIQKIIEERIPKMPRDVALAITSTPWAERIIKIANDNSLSPSKSALFQVETVLAIFGIESPKKYPENLLKNVGLDEKIVLKIAGEVDQQIITPIVDLLSKKPEAKAEFIEPKPAQPVMNEPPVKLIPKTPPAPAVPPTPFSNFGAHGKTLEIPPELLPETLPGQTAQTVKPDPKNVPPTVISTMEEKIAYEAGKDPYREPLQ